MLYCSVKRAMCQEMFFCGFLLLSLSACSSGIRLTRLDVPETADPRTRTRLVCAWDVRGDELQSVKWFRNDEEFMEFRPKDASFPSYKVYGISDQRSECDMELSQCTTTFLVFPELLNATFKCEISGEGPRFLVDYAERDMTVVALPTSEPQILGLPSEVVPFADVRLNCTVPSTLPVAKITWIVDGEVMNVRQHFHRSEDGLQASWSEVELNIQPEQARIAECRVEQLAYGRTLSLYKKTAVIAESPEEASLMFELAPNVSRGTTAFSASLCLFTVAIQYFNR